MVCKLHKAFYGLKQALRASYERLHTYLVKIGFERTDHNSNLYMNVDKEKGNTGKKLTSLLDCRVRK